MTAKEKLNHTFIKLTWKTYLFASLMQLVLVIWYGEPVAFVIFAVFYIASLVWFNTDLKIRKVETV